MDRAQTGVRSRRRCIAPPPKPVFPLGGGPVGPLCVGGAVEGPLVRGVTPSFVLD